MIANTTGTQNTALGQSALDANTTGNYNVALGAHALGQNTTASDNTAIGKDALTSNTTGQHNVALGKEAGLSNVTGSHSTFVGKQSGYYTTGDSNTFIGRSAGENVTTGTKNTVIGRYNGNQGGLDIRTSSNYIVLSDGDGNPRQIIDSSGQFRLNTTSHLWTSNEFASFDCPNDGVTVRSQYATLLLKKTAFANSNFVVFGDNSSNVVGSITSGGTSVAYNTTSDYRLKENIVDMTGATERLKQLNPVRFNFIADADTTVDGFLAHEVQDIVPEAITGTKDEVDDDGNAVYQGIDQSKLVPLLVATIQELEARIAALESN